MIEELGLYPREAFEFVSRGLSHTVNQLHGTLSEADAKAEQERLERGEAPTVSRHVSGRQLCEGLRDFALSQWGLLARTVLKRWNITRTDDFGRIVYAFVNNGIWMKTEEDSLEDFKSVFDFATAFEGSYRIECPNL